MRLARGTAVLSLVALSLAACSPLDTSPTGLRATERNARIVNGVADDGTYDAVGTAIWDWNADGRLTGDDAWCTGSLIAPTVYLTAAHCIPFIPAGEPLFVSFTRDLNAGAPTLIPVTAIHVHPAHFAQSKGMTFYHDLAVFLLPAGSTTGITPLELPPLGFLDGLAAKNGLRDVTFVNVGYGATASLTGRPSFAVPGERLVSQSPFMSISSVWLNLQMQSNATGLGGDCYGDSGSPKFLLGNPKMIVATVTAGDAPCRTLSKSWRLDTPEARAFLGAFVTLP